MKGTLRVLNAAGVQLAVEEIVIGEKVYLEGFTSGIKSESWDSLRRTKVFLNAPISTPRAGVLRAFTTSTHVDAWLHRRSIQSVEVTVPPVFEPPLLLPASAQNRRARGMGSGASGAY